MVTTACKHSNLYMEQHVCWNVCRNCTLKDCFHLHGSNANSDFNEENLFHHKPEWMWLIFVLFILASSVGSKLLEQKGVIVSLVNIAETCPYLSISGTAFYAMGLVACTTSGSESLATRGWVTIRHVRGDTWHVARDWLQQVRSCHKTSQNKVDQSIQTSYQMVNCPAAVSMFLDGFLLWVVRGFSFRY